MEGSEGEEEAGGQEGGLGREEKENALEGKRERESARRRKGWLARGRENARRLRGG